MQILSTLLCFRGHMQPLKLVKGVRRYGKPILFVLNTVIIAVNIKGVIPHKLRPNSIVLMPNASEDVMIPIIIKYSPMY